MVKFVALYKKPADVKSFDENYFGTHLELAGKIPGLKKVEVSKVVGSPMGESEYYLIADLYFDTMDDLKNGMSSPEGRAAGKNLMTFAKDIVQFMHVEVEKVPAAAGN